MFILTITIATVEIISGIRSYSNSLIADGLYSFAEGLCLIGVMLVLHWSQKERTHPKRNTFGHERLELLFGLIQEIFLLSISLGIIVDAVNHLVNPIHVHDPQLMIIIGGIGIIVGILGMVMFWGYHHDHDIEEEIHKNKKTDFLAMTAKYAKIKRPLSIENAVVEIPLMIEPGRNEISNKKISSAVNIPEHHKSTLDAFTYENVEIGESRIYATLHALCLHSFVSISNKKFFVLELNYFLGCFIRIRHCCFIGFID
jgi:Co/Zn/Cd efflux system component